MRRSQSIGIHEALRDGPADHRSESLQKIVRTEKVCGAESWCASLMALRLGQRVVLVSMAPGTDVSFRRAPEHG
ncbi:hypothetical protein COCON_G00134450 [Conger conger]|uniref:Uncharacterized protein n=1 Tax=Conger conger TaxID=82655 RepID=A0A9Q1DEG6_CONCO|nr:hypothetical protein COCON_G00134450 [Conger conger]